jgi:ketosteroid isomerase-like protein
MGSGNDEITTFLTEWTQAELHGDAASLDGFLVDDFVGVGPLGFLLSKQEWLARFAPGGMKYGAFSLEEAQVRDYGDTAVVVGRQSQSGTFRGNPLPYATVRTTLVLLNRSGGWRMASASMSFVAGTPGAPPLPGR